MVPNNQQQTPISILPLSLQIPTGPKDQNVILLSYDGQHWRSNDQAHHSNFGGYDRGARQSDAGLAARAGEVLGICASSRPFTFMSFGWLGVRWVNPKSDNNYMHATMFAFWIRKPGFSYFILPPMWSDHRLVALYL